MALCIILTFEPCDCFTLIVSEKARSARLHGSWHRAGGRQGVCGRDCQPEVLVLCIKWRLSLIVAI